MSEGRPVRGIDHLAPGTVVVTMRMMQLGNGPGLRRPAVRFSDFGLQHFALHVDDLDLATERFVAAGGTMFSGPDEMAREGRGQSVALRPHALGLGDRARQRAGRPGV